MSANIASQAKPDQAPNWRNPLTVAAGSLFAVHMALKYLPALGGKWPTSEGVDTVALGLAAIALVPWIAAFLTSAKFPGGVELAFRGVQQRQLMTERNLEQLRFIVEGFLTRDEYNHLKNIEQNVEYHVQPGETEALTDELRRLRALGLIAGFGVRDFARADGAKRRIGESFSLTQRGKDP